MVYPISGALREPAVSSFVGSMMLPKLKSATAAASLLLVTSFITTGCHTQSQHPNQINAFDGAAFDTMTLAYGALTSLRVSIAADFPSYAPEFNKAAEAYNAALAVYAAYRNSAEAETSVSGALGNLTVGIVSLEGVLLADLHVDTQHSAAIRKTAQKIRDRLSARTTVADILTELEIAASIASVAPVSGEYEELAKAVITATAAALTAEQAGANKPIQLGSLAAIQPIS